ncbi:MAG: T9SS type A sorting domain-containing protein, partial [Ignavibacteriaceae bacterium]|nr:T9SS type A sorting domain-containing protein [Ignavibacteriaceae bacterium]
TEIASARYIGDNDDVVVEVIGDLTIGNWYYISVDNNYANYRGTFTLCLADNDISYDFYEGAINVSALIDDCSADAEYTTYGMTGDKNAASTWNTSPNYNVWFKFQATSFAINVNVLRGGSYGTIRRINAAIWEADGTTEVASNRYVSDNDNVYVGSVDLVPGNWYYISVDNNYANYRGTFTLCIDDDVDYDFYDGAQILTNLSDWSSDDAAYTTLGATADKNAASTWNTSPNYNRWFKFKATSDQINVIVKRGGDYGTIRRINVALWESDGTTEINSNRYVSDNDNVSISALNLTVDNWYYISVDNNYANYRGTFSLYVNDEPDYDYYEGAYLIDDINNWCSDDAEFTTLGATADKNAGSCWNTGPNYNRWFKFQAVSDGISVTAKRGGDFGTIRRINLALWEDDGTTEIDCNRYVSDNDNVSVSSNNLTPGNWYYVSVDNNYANYRGTFTLCVDDQPTYDYKAGAIELVDLDNWCSNDAEYTTIGATADENAASCWNTSPNYNRWFKFQAIFDTVTIDVKTQGAEGTVRRLNVALWESDGTTEVECLRYSSDYDDIQIVNGDLTPGDWYYISVDNNYANYRGTFTLCVSNVSANVYYAIDDGDWGTNSTWSRTEGGAPASDTPGSANKVYIKGYDITVTSAEQAATLDIDIEDDNTTLEINGVDASLTVNGDMTFTNNGNDLDGIITITSGGNLSIDNDLTITRNGGANLFYIDIQNNSNITVSNSLAFYSTAGSVNLNEIMLSGDATLAVSNDLIMDFSGGMKIKMTLDNATVMQVNHDIQFTANAEDKVEIELNNTAELNIGGNFLRGSPAYGILDCNDNSTIGYVSDSYLQIWAENVGEGADGFSYQNVIINNTKVSSPQITLEGTVIVPGTLTMTQGDISTGSDTLKLGADAGNPGTLAYTSGSIIGNYEKWITVTSPTTYYLPVGTEQYDRPMEIEFNNLSNGSIVAKFISGDPGESGLPVDDNGEDIYDIFIDGYWSIGAENSLTSNNYNLTIEAENFDDFDFTTETRLLTRVSSGDDWTADGSHVAANGDTVFRTSITTLPAEFGIGDNSCILPTSSITGNDEVPEYSENEDYFVSSNSGYIYNWTVTGGSIESGNGSNIIEVNWDADGVGNVAVIASYQGCTADQVDLPIEIYGPVYSQTDGSWDDPGTWDGGEVPSFKDNVVILGSDAVTLASNVLIRNLTVNGDLDNNGFELTLTGDYTINGTHTSTGDDKVFLSGVNKNIDGSGTLNLDGRFQITTGNKNILNTADLDIISGDLYIASGIVVYNNGIITLTEQLQGQNANSTWENRASSTLYVGGDDANAILSTGKLKASYADNTIYYNRAGDQSIKVPVNNEYYNLTIESTNSNLLGDITVLGDLITDGTFDFDDNDLSFENSWTLNGSFIQGNGVISLTGSNNQSFEGTYTNLTINKSGGEISLSNTLNISNVLTLTSGNIDLGSNDLVITNSASGAISGGSASSYIQADGTGKVIWDVALTTTMTFPVGDNNDYSPFTFYLNSGTLASANISLNLTDAAHPELTGSTDYISRYWTLEESGISSPDYNVSYVYTDGDIIGDEAIILPCKYSSGWTKGSTTAITGTNTLTWDNITSFSDFSGGEGGALPIELIYFKGQSTQQGVILTWKTATEINNDFFTIERSGDAVNFTEIAQIEGAGNSLFDLTYSSIDKYADKGYQYYRLSQTDYDGTTEYFQIISVLNDLIVNNTNKSIEVYPNPFTKETKPKIKLSGFEKGEIIVFTIYNNNGLLLKESTIVLKNSIDIVELPKETIKNNGLYYLKVFSKNTGYYKAIKVVVK